MSLCRSEPDRERDRAEAWRAELAAWAAVEPARVRLVRSPYRICPLGAHVDHQLGEVTGMALDRALLLAFAPRTDGRVILRSRQFPGEARFELGSVPARPCGDWADYARGAAVALQRRARLRAGMTAIVDGHDDVGGLSSSAAAGVAYLLALEAANGLELDARENIELDRAVENDYLGLSNGILDQAMILLSRAGCLTWLDCRSGQSRLIEPSGPARLSIAVLFSGLRGRLAETDYNRRVEECRRAARLLLERASLEVPEPPTLRAVPPEVFRRHGGELPEPLRRRAEHFFGEQRRVRAGLEAWRRGDMAAFGRLVSESGASSVRNYECGNAHLRAAYEALRDCPGVYGARFSGAGFRGCCIGLADPDREDEIAERALSSYLSACPDMSGRARIYFCRSGPAASVLD